MKKKNHTGWRVPVTGALLLATAVAAEQDEQTYLDSTNRVTLSLRLGLNITGQFKGVGSTFAPGAPLANARYTPHGDKYNYDDGYVLNDKSGSKDGLTWYWGYDNAGQIGASGANTVTFQRTDVSGLPGETSDDNSPYVGAELSYDYELGKDDWRHLYYGIEGAVNYTPITFGGSGTYNLSLSQETAVYGYTPGTTPPSANLPYQGSFGGPGFVINSQPSSLTSAQLGNASFLVQQVFNGNLFGFRVGPYVDYLPSTNWDIHVSGGLAVGVMQASASWKETITLPGGAPGSITSVSGSGDDVGLLGGFYVGTDVEYKFNNHWSVDGGVQFQDIGNYSHNFGGRVADVDLSQSVFVTVGINYSF